MPVVDNRQPRPDVDNTGADDRKNRGNKPKRIRKSSPDHYQKYGKAHYEKNKAAYIARADARKKQGREEFAAFKSTLRCTKCGQDHPATLDFHHVVRKPENRKVHRLVANGQYEAAMREIQEKCVVLCSNCHRIEHYKENLKSV